jgi:dUTP pyrophosphatase
MRVVLDADAQMPAKAHENDDSYNLYAAESAYIRPNSSAVIDTGVHIEISKGMFGLVDGRSGLNFIESIICPKGTIDSRYTGSIKVKLYNLSGEPKAIKRGDRIAQIMFMKVESPVFERVDSISETERGEGGFGSTGT